MTVYKLTREGRVPAAKIGGQWRFKRDVLDEWLESQMRKQTVDKN
jgi:PTS system nitrogen regulatory IIA component